jgi:hypothetical protein
MHHHANRGANVEEGGGRSTAAARHVDDKFLSLGASARVVVLTRKAFAGGLAASLLGRLGRTGRSCDGGHGDRRSEVL